MKRHLHNSFRALFLSIAVLLSLPMLAEKVEIDGINYDLIPKGKVATVIKKSSGSYSGEVVIPESVEHEGITYSVTSIREKAFYDCKGLTSVTIPNSVTSIGDYAFYFCKGLTSVTIPNSVTSIGEGAFYYCSGLTSVTIPNSVTSVGEYTFYHCSGLTSVTIPNSVMSIGEHAFDYCDGLTSVHISDIAAWCNIEFSDNYSNPLWYAKHLYLNGEEVKDLIIPNGVTSVGSHAFYYCDGLTSVTIPNSVTSIGGGAFAYCSGLTSVHISDIAAWCNIEFDDYYANPLYYARHLYLNGEEVKDLVIPNSVTSIGSFAFYYCSGLTSVAIPNSVTSIGNNAFYNCSGLTSVTIPNSVTSIGWSAFNGCSGLTSVTIPNSVTSIGGSAFYYCKGLTSVTIPNSVTSIGSSAFYGCSGLSSVTIPNSVTSIESSAFRGCSGLTSVTIGSGVKNIYSRAFANCPELLDVYCYAEKVPSTESDAFNGSYPEYATLHVPAAYVDSYKAKSPWSKFGKIMGLSGGEPEEPEVPEVEKCATPVVAYVDGCLEISSDTDGANYVTKLVAEDAKEYYESKIELIATYNIEVFATKTNCENSDTVSVALVWVENGEVNEETGVISVEAAPVLIQGNGGVLSVSGVAKGTDVVVYTISGTEVARATTTDGTTTINTGLQSGTIAIVKFGNKSVKVRI